MAGPLKTRITILVDNEIQPQMGLMAEHGFSALIEREGSRILFDTGQGPALINNAMVLGISLSPLDMVVLSHGHYDHTGGLTHIVQKNPAVRIVTHPDSLEPHYAKFEVDASPKSIGIPMEWKSLEAMGAIFDFFTDFRELTPGVWYSGEVPRKDGTAMDKRLVTYRDNVLINDPMKDDVSLLLETPSGPVVVFGCAHAGVDNIMDYMCEKRDITDVTGVLGGTHLGLFSDADEHSAIQTLERYHVACVATGHCTGAGPNGRLKAHFGSRFREGCAGAVFEF
jgi:7,8-dihydropterin-6-yl-methyl-4-(beta-D-ribofuranosyl)aminobenzene 5'-phosphate synthase